MKYFGVFIFLILLRTTDLYITYLITPDLSQELNPLISKLALGWSGFLPVQFLLILLALLGYQRFSSRLHCPVNRPGLGLVKFVYYYFNQREPDTRIWIKGFFRLPDKYYLKANGAFIGFVVFAGFIFVSLFAILHNLLILAGVDSYLEFVINFSRPYMISVYVLLVLISANIFFLMEYRRYRMVVAE